MCQTCDSIGGKKILRGPLGLHGDRVSIGDHDVRDAIVGFSDEGRETSGGERRFGGNLKLTIEHEES